MKNIILCLLLISPFCFADDSNYIYCPDSITCDTASAYSCHIDNKTNDFWSISQQSLRPKMNAGRYYFDRGFSEINQYTHRAQCEYRNGDILVWIVQNPNYPISIMPVDEGYSWNFTSFTTADCANSGSEIDPKTCPFTYTITLPANY